MSVDPWPPPPALVEYVCPYDSDPRHFDLTLLPSVPRDRVEQAMKRHLDEAHPGWTIEELTRLAEEQRQNPSIISATQAHAQAEHYNRTHMVSYK